ncbi:MAG: FAD-dependent oxidoreductase, partial [Salinimicrobium sp.]
TEMGAVNLCYLATYESFKNFKDPQLFQEKVLQKNPFLKDFLREATPLFEAPLAIAQISFSKKDVVHEHMLMLGDAAGLIHPLCGNGMAMAIHSGKIASQTLMKHLENPEKFSRKKLEQEYTENWQREFRGRLTAGKYLQKVLLNDNLAEMSQAFVAKFPFLLPMIIKTTHGRPII